MNLISTSWSCARCGAAFIGTPPEHGLCDQCLADLERSPGWHRSPPALPDLRRPGLRRLRASSSPWPSRSPAHDRPQLRPARRER